LSQNGRFEQVPWKPVGDRGQRETAHFQCPFCKSYDVVRVYLASVRLDSCECATCGARWDEDAGHRRFRGRPDSASIFIPRPRR